MSPFVPIARFPATTPPTQPDPHPQPAHQSTPPPTLFDPPTNHTPLALRSRIGNAFSSVRNYGSVSSCPTDFSARAVEPSYLLPPEGVVMLVVLAGMPPGRLRGAPSFSLRSDRAARRARCGAGRKAGVVRGISRPRRRGDPPATRPSPGGHDRPDFASRMPRGARQPHRRRHPGHFASRRARRHRARSRAPADRTSGRPAADLTTRTAHRTRGAAHRATRAPPRRRAPADLLPSRLAPIMSPTATTVDRRVSPLKYEMSAREPSELM